MIKKNPESLFVLQDICTPSSILINLDLFTFSSLRGTFKNLMSENG
ncbi:hypothetical protein BTN49_1152 [Candidatus Enterovibrio escicola]|uniref:Uncharacterized protein n=1 Tax=Candidatus Enterovibrio escicola TaxID=1927127 RepID=A0A2A5T4T5_9GAMM|nr:hypothetical protein BTN49_1152 [Candidatus Enterovibrio escacola]